MAQSRAHGLPADAHRTPPCWPRRHPALLAAPQQGARHPGSPHPRWACGRTQLSSLLAPWRVSGLWRPGAWPSLCPGQARLPSLSVPSAREGPAVLLFSVLFSPRLSPGAWHKLMPTQASEGSSPAVAASPTLRRPCWCSLWGGAVPCSAAVGLWDGDLLPRLSCAAREGSALFCVSSPERGRTLHSCSLLQGWMLGWRPHSLGSGAALCWLPCPHLCVVTGTLSFLGSSLSGFQRRLCLPFT